MDTLTPKERSERMSRVRNKNTKPEFIVRRMVYQLGHRYRLHGKKLPGHPDLVFPSRKKAIFVHGCFWHRHPDPTCWRVRMPKSRQDFWQKKFEDNVRRDQENIAALKQEGWDVLVLWECQIRQVRKLDEVRASLIDFLGPPRAKLDERSQQRGPTDGEEAPEWDEDGLRSLYD